jgi:hypothetical protein
MSSAWRKIRRNSKGERMKDFKTERFHPMKGELQQAKKRCGMYFKVSPAHNGGCPYILGQENIKRSTFLLSCACI